MTNLISSLIFFAANNNIQPPSSHDFLRGFQKILENFLDWTKSKLKRSIFNLNWLLDLRRIPESFAMMVEEAQNGSDDEDNSNSQLTELKGN